MILIEPSSILTAIWQQMQRNEFKWWNITWLIRLWRCDEAAEANQVTMSLPQVVG